jgi:hypothetical protein
MVIGTTLGWHNAGRVVLSVVLAFFFGYALMLVIPGAMDAGLDTGLFWGSLALSLLIAGAAAFPVNWWLVSRGKGHAMVHQHHD